MLSVELPKPVEKQLWNIVESSYCKKVKMVSCDIWKDAT
jgi:hypothetical protein